LTLVLCTLQEALDINYVHTWVPLHQVGWYVMARTITILHIHYACVQAGNIDKFLVSVEL